MNENEQVNSLVDKLMELDATKWNTMKKSDYKTFFTSVMDISIYVSQVSCVTVYSPGMIGVNISDNGEPEERFKIILQNPTRYRILIEKTLRPKQIGPIERLYCHLMETVREEADDYFHRQLNELLQK